MLYCRHFTQLVQLTKINPPTYLAFLNNQVIFSNPTAQTIRTIKYNGQDISS